MINEGQINSEELKMQGLLDRYLNFRSSTVNSDTHLDEDSLNAFVEGKMSQRELSPVIKHLIDCSFCLNVTAELAKLEMAFAEEEMPVALPAAEPAKVSDVLKGLLSRFFGTQDNAVFAHQENKEEQEEEKTEDKKDS